MEPLDRATIWPYREGKPGELYYQRYAHPNALAAEAKLAELEGGEALLFPSGAGATTALVLALLEPGQTIALAEGGYYGTGVLFDALERWGVRHVEFDQTGPPPEGVELVWLEAPSNPFLTMPDLEAAVASPARVVVDSTAATPVYLRPLDAGADFALHSATKYLGGHDDVLLGAVACRSAEDAERLREFRGRTGIVAAPDPCWLLSRSLKTLRVRMERHTASATAIAEPAARPPGGRGRPLSGLRRTSLVRRRGRRGRSQGRDLAADDRERHQPRRGRVGAGVANALGGRPRAAGPAPPERRPRGRGRALGRPRASPGLSTYVFFPEGAFGPTNNCVGIGRVLLERGERVVFVVEESFAGTLEAQGFEEALMRLKPAPEVEEAPGQFWKDFVRDTAPEFRKPTIEQLETFVLPVWQELVDGARYVDERLAEIFAELEPDVIVQDNVVGFPAVLASGRPWVRIVSCNPLELKDPALPPVFSGYPHRRPGRLGRVPRALPRAARTRCSATSRRSARSAAAPPLPELEFVHESPWLNLYLYPAEADYERSRPLGERWHRLDSCVRSVDEPFEPPPGDGALVYVSLGSLGSADVELMNRLVAALAETPHRYVVSKGPQHESIELAPNMTGAEFLPQPAILPQVDLVITHGGNNTVTESIHFGKPMIVLPLFWDQHDNAQRMAERGFGVRLPTYEFEDAQLHEAIDRLLSTPNAGLAEASLRLQSQPGTVRAAGLIEEVGGAHP